MADFNNNADSAAVLHNEKLMMEQLVALPQRILKHHEIDNLADIVLHSLSHNHCFGLKRATYLMDNPDFDHLKGVSSFTKEECSLHKDDVWQSPESFNQDMLSAEYHNKIRGYLKNSLKKKDIDLHNAQDIKDLGHDLGMENPSFHCWHMKHGNHGLLIFEKEKQLDLWQNYLLNNFSALLSMCAH